MFKDSRMSDLARLIIQCKPGYELDRYVSHIIFREKCEPCKMEMGKYHLVGSSHLKGFVEGIEICTMATPEYSTDLKFDAMISEWLCTNFPGMELVFDSESWFCNVNSRDKTGKWFRVVHTPSCGSRLEALIKAALLACVSPQSEPIQVKLIMDQVKLEKKRNARRKKRTENE